MRYLYALEIAALILLSVYGANASADSIPAVQEEPTAESFVQPLSRCAEDAPLTHTAAESSSINTSDAAAAECVTEPYVYKLPSVKLQCKQIFEDLGYGPVQVAAILGNIQVESCFRPGVYGHYGSRTYYGLFQWDLLYNPQAEGMTITQQCLFVHEGIQSKINYKWVQSFLNCTKPADAAELFAEGYEKCNKKSYKTRSYYAEKYYEELYGKE